MNYLVTPEASDHLALAILPCLPEQRNPCGKKLSRHVPGPEDVKEGQGQGQGRVCGGIHVVAAVDGISTGGQSTKEREGSPL